MSVDHFEYPDLALTVDRGAVGQPSRVCCKWMIADEAGENPELSLELSCHLLLDTETASRELRIVSVGGHMIAAADFRKSMRLFFFDGSDMGCAEVADTGDYDNERLHEIAQCLAKSLLIEQAEQRFPTLFVKVLP